MGMKRREYSVASSQKVTPNSISLLIVTVNWVDPKGRDRFGQATRYLNSLPVGAPVTVSVKPSVMKLPPKSTQPIIMAGLGTGLAPFRAFVQERAWQREQGMPIGDVFLYMGARHQREEYLYGEEWEAYQDAGIITLIGRAFSVISPKRSTFKIACARLSTTSEGPISGRRVPSTCAVRPGQSQTLRLSWKRLSRSRALPLATRRRRMGTRRLRN